jgi:hypothetical protein
VAGPRADRWLPQTFAGDHAGAQGLFGAPIGRVDGVRIEEKSEERGPLDAKMGGEALDIGY